MNDKVAQTGYEHIAGKFRRVDDFGPKTVRLFCSDNLGSTGLFKDAVLAICF